MNSNNGNSNIKGTFSHWSDSSARWYEEASQYTNYHQELKKYIAPYLSIEETCCELACGTGTLARCLAPLTASYTANDIDPQSLQFCEKIQKKHPLPNLTFLPGDWKTVLGEKTFDTVIFSYFGVILTDWELLRRIASKKIIAILPRYNASELREKEKSMDVRIKKDSRGRRHDFETMNSVCAFLDMQSISYDAIPLTLEFGQPCRTLEDAEAYVRYYYKLKTDDEVQEFIRLKFKPADCGYFYSKKKNIAIIAIDMTSFK